MLSFINPVSAEHRATADLSGRLAGTLQGPTQVLLLPTSPHRTRELWKQGTKPTHSHTLLLRPVCWVPGTQIRSLHGLLPQAPLPGWTLGLPRAVGRVQMGHGCVD